LGKGENMFDIPVAFFTFNRLDCAKRVFERIRKVQPARLYLISDGAREGVDGEWEKINVVRQYLTSHVDWECEIYKNFSETNMGCGWRIPNGISWVFEREEKLIILEDDCLADISFFRYCKELLDLYEDQENIMLVGGYNPLGNLKRNDSFIYTPFAEIWGWATWKRAWKQYDYDIAAWKERKITPYMKKIMNGVAIQNYSRMFDLVYAHKLDAWDYQLQYLIFQKQALTIVPSKNMVTNIGFGAEATHTKEVPEALYNESHTTEFPLRIPSQIKADKRYNKEILKIYGNTSLIKTIKRFLHMDPNKSIFERRNSK